MSMTDEQKKLKDSADWIFDNLSFVKQLLLGDAYKREIQLAAFEDTFDTLKKYIDSLTAQEATSISGFVITSNCSTCKNWDRKNKDRLTVNSFGLGFERCYCIQREEYTTKDSYYSTCKWELAEEAKK